MKGQGLNNIPTHVAIIMDGNGRWARQRGLSRSEGHRAGTENLRLVVDTFIEYQVKYLTLYAFSTENWGRPKLEVKGLMRIMDHVVRRETKTFHEQGVRLYHIGRLDRLSARLQEEVRYAMELTRENDKLFLSLAFDYGGRDEILQAVRRIVEEGIPPDLINEGLFSQYLYTAGLPEPDLIIRTGKETRISNFFLWQSAYSELHFTPVLWPDFGRKDIEEALLDYGTKERRFGKLHKEG